MTKKELGDKIDVIRKKMGDVGRNMGDMDGYCKVWTYTQQIGPLDPLCALLMWTRKARTSTRRGRMVDHVLAAA